MRRINLELVSGYLCRGRGRLFFFFFEKVEGLWTTTPEGRQVRLTLSGFARTTPWSFGGLGSSNGQLIVGIVAFGFCSLKKLTRVLGSGCTAGQRFGKFSLSCLKKYLTDKIQQQEIRTCNLKKFEVEFNVPQRENT